MAPPSLGDAPNEFKLNEPPDDGISAVKFSPTSVNFLLVSSWDSVCILVNYVLKYQNKLSLIKSVRFVGWILVRNLIFYSHF